MIFIILATNYSILSNIIISYKKLGQFLLSKLVLLEFNSFNKKIKLQKNQHQPYSHNLTAFGAGSFLLCFILMFPKVYPKEKDNFSPSWKDIPFNHVCILGGSHVQCEGRMGLASHMAQSTLGKIKLPLYKVSYGGYRD